MEDIEHNIELKACVALKSELCGSIIKHSTQEVITHFLPTQEMVCGESHFIHSGFIFNAANYAAMCLINHANALTIKSEIEFLAPLELDQEMSFLATIKQSNDKMHEVNVKGSLLDIKIFEAIFYIAIFDKQLFKLNLKDF